MHFTVYKITNLINNKIYVGAHKTNNLHDDYYGSGVAIKRAIKKYGLDNFNKTILFDFACEKDMFDKESEIVNDDFVKNNNTYNMTVGGFGSWSHIDSSGKHNRNYNNHSPLSPEHKKKIGLACKGSKNGMYGKTHTDKVKKLLSDINSVPWEERMGKDLSEKLKVKVSERFKNIPKTTEQKQKMSESAKLRYKNKPNVELICPHCGKKGKGAAMKQWHFDNCRYKDLK